MHQQGEPIAIIGSSCRFPGESDTPSKLWNLLRQPRDLLAKIPTDRFNAKAFYHPDPTHHGTTNVQESYFLSENPRQFDSQFFGIQPMESESIDPQQRMLLEAVYESISAAGQTMEGLRGSSTAVFVGLMCDDWSGILGSDWDALPTYAATGMARSIISNRVSYFFDWHGPSMTIDTACSSSLVAVHQAVQVLRSGESPVAIAAGANLILSPGMYIAESKLRMLSPTGRSRMWDENADGYARGEGIASVVLKTLSSAIRDGDHIECIIRETGLNQDGRTTGITMPSNAAQTDLIRQTYARAGLDPDNTHDRPQFFHAHGTGTPAGDPQEAEAISKAFFSHESSNESKLYVGSIKTIIGHTEGTAGLASLIGASLAVQNGIIPPNMHFGKLSDKVAPFYRNLEVATESEPWPTVPHGHPRRVSVNSFGFGGSNAHAILENYESTERKVGESTLFTPLTFSAASERALQATLASYSEFLKANLSLNLRDLAWTLQLRRSVLPFKTTVSGMTINGLASNIDSELAKSGDGQPVLGVRSSNSSAPRLLGVFTGQGAQWPRMGCELIIASPYAREILAMLDRSLAELPKCDRPSWSIEDELLADASSSRLADAELSQPLCTALQIVLVDLLHSAGIQFEAVVGHSSGEIGAAYAAGYISAYDAIRIAYYRGLYATLARSPNGKKGTMAAIGTSLEDAAAFCDLERFNGRLVVAASNSSTSITLSGDEDAIAEAIEIFNDEQKFARKLQVSTAYHSFHMSICAEPYIRSISACKITIADEGTTKWFSSVVPGQRMTKATLTDEYWLNNMTNPVMFSDAVASAVLQSQPFDLVLEIGPHPALKAPCMENLEQASERVGIAYSGLLSRGKNCIETLSAALGFVWKHLGFNSVDFDAYDRVVSGDLEDKRLVVDLPTYPWDHERIYGAESRTSGAFRTREDLPHPLLGVKCVESTTPQEIRWRNLLRSKEVSWLKGHKLQGQIVFPASGYVIMAIEALRTLAGNDKANFVEVQDLVIGRAIAFSDEFAGVETLISLNLGTSQHPASVPLVADFECYSCPEYENTMSLNASGRVLIHIGDSLGSSLPPMPLSNVNMVDVDVGRFYSTLAKLGYGYSDAFQGISAMKREVDLALGTLVNRSGDSWADQLIVHPGLLDTAFQSVFAAYCSPGDNRLWSIHVPTKIRSIIINPNLCGSNLRKEAILPFKSSVRSEFTGDIRADVDVHCEGSHELFIQIDAISLVPFSRASPDDDSLLFSKFEWGVSCADGEVAARNERPSAYEKAVAHDLERVCLFYLKFLVKSITSEEELRTLSHYRYLITWASHVVTNVSLGTHAWLKQEWLGDTHDQILEITNRYPERVNVRLIQVVGENLPVVVRDRTNILEFMAHDGLLSKFYEEGLGLNTSNRWIGRMARQVAHRYPHMHIFEIGAGTGGATKAILEELDSAFSSYTYTDISSGFFEDVQERFKDHANRMIFKTFDMEKSIAAQGYVEGHYDMIIASNVLHATKSLEETMMNTRRLLKPGGNLLLLEVTNSEALRNGLPMGGLPGWWVGADSGRPWGPTLSLPEWDSLLRKTGFSGVDTTTPNFDSLAYPFSVFATQAVDDRIRILRRPLNILPTLMMPDLEDLVIIGGKTLQTSRLVENIVDLLTQRFQSITRINSVDEIGSHNISVSSNILSVAELDESTFKIVTAIKLECLKILFTKARNILWITRGARADEPHSNMMIGIGRAVRFEYPHINLQMLDVDKIDNASSQTFAESLIRLQTVERWQREEPSYNLLYSTEPEVAIEEGRQLVLRLLPQRSQNDRYNSSRRLITRQVSTWTSPIRIVGTGSSFEMQDNSALDSWPNSSVPEAITIQVTHSTLQAVKINLAGYFFLCHGFVRGTGDSVLAVSEINGSIIELPRTQTVACQSSLEPSKILLSVAGNLLAHCVTLMTPTGGTLLVHEPEDFVFHALAKKAADKNIKMYCTTTREKNTGSEWIHIHPGSSPRLIKSVLPTNVSRFVDFAVHPDTKAMGSRIAEILPANCRIENTSPFFSSESVVCPGFSSTMIGGELKAAWADFKAFGTQTLRTGSFIVLPVKDLSLLASRDQPTSIVDWTASETVLVKVRPVDSEKMFRPDRTYLLLGLSGEVGQSICKWMVDRGARYLVLTSRSPKVKQGWIDSLEVTGATIKVLPMDITHRESLHACYDEICRTLPPVAGVANGAMVLQDKMFQNMDLSTMVEVLKPKVDGSKYLDDLFSENTLDFFILFSSMSSVVGNSGQSNYIAANMFMTSLVFQRKKRGLAGSVIDISSLVGIGYVEHSDHVDAEYFTRIGYTNISEQDLHQMFAEAVLAGRPGSHESPEIVTGLAPAYTDAEVKAPYRNDLKFCHFLIERLGEKHYVNQTAVIAVKTQLSTAMSKAEVYKILKRAFKFRLQQILQTPADDQVSETMTLVEQGVDSLIAVEVRSWFLKELDIDMPVLKVLGGASVLDLTADSFKKLPSNLVPRLELLKELGPTLVAKSSNEEVEKNEAPQVQQQKAEGQRDKCFPADLEANVDSLPTASSLESEQNQDVESKNSLSLSESESRVKNAISLSGHLTETTERMSFGQSRFWFLSHFLQDQTTFNMAFSVRLEGHLRVGDLEKAIHAVSEKHEALRTRFFSVGAQMEHPLQGILESSLISLRKKSITDQREAMQALDEMRGHVWDLNHWETMRVMLFSLSTTTHFLLVGCHHIAMDGLSFQIFFADLNKAYTGQTLTPCPAECQYRAFSVQQHRDYENGSMEADIEFYRDIIPKDPQPLPLFPFARVSSRKILDGYGSHKADFRLDPALTARIKEQSKKHKATTFHFYLATLQTLIGRLLPNVDEFFIGIADANRTDTKFTETLGFFLNLLPLLFRKGVTKTFSSAISDAREKAYSALEHSKLPFDALLNELNISRSATHTPLFQVFVDYRQGVQERSTFAGCEAKGEHWHTAQTGYDMTLGIIENNAGDSLLTLELQKSLYSSSDAKMLLQSYVNLLASFSMNTSVALETPSLFQKADIDSAITLGRGRSMPLEWPITLSHRIDVIAQEQGSNIAIKDGIGNSLTYTQMAGRVNAITAALQAGKTLDGDIVAIFQEPSSDWICSLLAIFRIGAVYVPLDLRTPLPRLASIVKNCQPRIILTHRPTVEIAFALNALDATTINVTDLPQSDSHMPHNRADPSSPAVILFTSGTTGIPKGIVINHSNLRNQMESYSKEWNIAAGVGMVLQQSAFSFDFSIDQIFAALANGGALYVVPASQRGDPISITNLMVTEGITYTSATPSEYLMWIRYGAPNLASCSNWQYAFAGGEPLAEALIYNFRSLGLSDLRLFNNYGPAEITVASTKIEIPYNNMPVGEPVPAGYMLPNYSVYIVDEHLNPLPTGFRGEIVIGGGGVSSGYLDNEGLTKQKFLPDVFATSDSTYVAHGWRIMYRTGDRGKLRDDGALICEGRIEGDTQIKLRGFRIELEDIENTILQVAKGVLIKAVVSLRGQTDEQFLVAHVILEKTHPAVDREDFLKRLPSLLPLPLYMCPAVVIALDNLPLTYHLKLDRSAIRVLPLPEIQDDADSAELTEEQTRLRSIWQEILPHAHRIAADTDFFLVGGNSLLLVKLQAIIRETFAVVLRLVDLMNTPILRHMSLIIQDTVRTHNIDWAADTTLQYVTLSNGSRSGSPTKASKQTNDNLVVLLTGATGYLGRHILSQLVADRRISKIHCVAIRENNEPIDKRLSVHSGKLMLRAGDLSYPLLGLTSTDFAGLTSSVDVILHCGANRSFWDSYATLQPTNVAPVKELVRLALPRKIPIHFMSSGGVHKYDTMTPPVNGTDGYIASKWAAEQYLSSVANEFALPVYIHRPLAAVGTNSFVPDEVLQELLGLAKKMGTVPSFDGLQGSIDLIPTSEIVGDILGKLFEDPDAVMQNPLFIHHESWMRVGTRALVEHLKSDADVRCLPSTPALQWIGDAKKTGFSYFIASQDIAMGFLDEVDTAVLVSRR